MKVKASTNLILLISDITFLLSEVRNYHARLVKKITIPKVFPEIIADLDLLVSCLWKWKRGNLVKIKCFIYMHQVGQCTLYKCYNSKINMPWFYHAMKKSVAAIHFGFIKRRTSCPELDVFMLSMTKVLCRSSLSTFQHLPCSHGKYKNFKEMVKKE